MRIQTAIVILAILVASATWLRRCTAVPPPRIVHDQLLVPAAMARAVRAYDPDFVPCDGPSAVVGDFNQDGRPDVAVRGHTAGTTSLLVILSGPTSPRVLELKYSAWRPGQPVLALSPSPTAAFRESSATGFVDYVWSDDRFTRQLAPQP